MIPKTMMEEFLKMKTMVEELYHRAQGEGESLVKVNEEVESSARAEGEGEGGEPLKTPSSPSSSSGASEHSSHKKKHSKKSSHSRDFPLLKLDVKFYFPTYDGELNVEKLDN